MRVLSLCTGYGGLDRAVEQVTGATVAAVSDIDKGARRILAHRYPGVPNLGDIKTIDWADWAGTEIVTAGYPCQPFSKAGKLAGTDDPRHIFPDIIRGVRVVGPRLVVLENVREHLVLGFDAVLGALADAGYDATWTCLTASAVGACHRRQRVFIVATPWDAHDPGLEGWADAGRPDQRATGTAGLDVHTPPLTLLPTPVVNDMGAGKTVDAWDAWTDRMQDAHGNGNGHGKSLSIEALRLHPVQWGPYAAAIARHGSALGRPAPSPTQPGTKGQHHLSPRFVEWMMMQPAGWVTDVPGLTRTEQLKALGNGVVTPQAVAALQWLLTQTEAAAQEATA